MENLVWKSIQYLTEKATRIQVPTLLVDGYWDNWNMLRTLDLLRAGSAPAVRSQHRVLMGPWTHFAIGERQTYM